MNMTSSSLQCEVPYGPAMTLGGAAQLVAAHCWMNRLVTLQSTAITDPPMLCPSQPHYGLHPTMFFWQWQWLTILVTYGMQSTI